MPDYMEVCENAARSAGEVLLDWQGRFRVTEKGIKDLVTEADVASQEAIRETLMSAFPSHGFLSEEQSEEEQRSTQSAEFCWIVDPLDGTTNYVHQLPSYSVSIGLRNADRLILGVVYDPTRDECFSAQTGDGARLNGVALQASKITTLDQALVAASFPPNVLSDSPEVISFIEVLQEAQAVRRLGSAALNLSYLAAGRLDAYWATSVKPWDVAAGWLIAQEAGGIVSDVDGSPADLAAPSFAAAATSTLHRQLLEVLGRASG